jgi:photosystem II stability/assembly factor-like uncharacterized protein
MKAIAFLYILTAGTGLAQLAAEYGWSWQNPLPQGNTLWAVTAVDSNTVVAVGDHAILRTTDGGFTWKAVATTEYLTSICFTDANNGTAVGSAILRTTDGGATWQRVPVAQHSLLFSVFFSDADNGTAVGANGEILRTTDGGATWKNQVSGVMFNHLHGVAFTDASAGTVVGDGIILRTRDGGAAWNVKLIDSALSAVTFTDANTGIGVGSNGTILLTTDGGATWRRQSSASTTAFFFSVSFSDENTGTVVGCSSWDSEQGDCTGGGIILRTTDGGVTWAPQSSASNILFGVSITDSHTGSAVGDGGTILRTTDGGCHLDESN